jgi:ABC-type dipeptide/oligopeptide/nickel transport system permease subunit
MKRIKELLSDIINLLLFLAGLFLIFILLALLDPSVKSWITALFFKP